MQLYPGLAPLTVNTSGSGSPGVLVSSGSADPHGVWPTPDEMVGADPRLAANLMAAVEGLTSRSNWISWRIPDPIAGGDYRSLFTGAVTVANQYTVDRSAINDVTVAITAQGGGGGGPGGDFYQGPGNASGGWGLRGTGGNSSAGGVGIIGIGGSVSGAGVKGTPGAANNIAVWANGGRLFVDTNIAGPSTTPFTNSLYATNIAKAWGNANTNGSGAAAVGGGFNFASATIATTTMTVNFATPMADAFYDVSVTIWAGSTFYLAGAFVPSTTGFTFQAVSLTAGAPGAVGALVNFATLSGVFTFHVFAKQ